MADYLLPNNLSLFASIRQQERERICVTLTHNLLREARFGINRWF